MKRLKTDETKELRKRFIDVYFDWHKKTIGMIPQYDGTDGKMLPGVYSYIRRMIFEGKGMEPSIDDIVVAWEYILKNYDSWDLFHKKQTRFRQIASNLTNIMLKLKNKSSGQSISRNGIDSETKNRIKEMLK